MKISDMKIFITDGDNKKLIQMFYKSGITICNQLKDANIVVFPGGHDISPSLYGQSSNPMARVKISTKEDLRDRDVWNLASPKQLKVGIGRGAQFLNVMNGGSLYQNVNNHANNHTITDLIYDIELTVNSHHHQMMIPAKSAEVLAIAENVADLYVTQEGIIPDSEIPEYEPEVLFYERTNCLCFQPHPELEDNSTLTKSYFFSLLDLI